MKQLRNSVVKWLLVSLLCLLFGFSLGKFQQDILDDKISLMAVDLHTMKIRNSRLETEFSRITIMSETDQQTIRSLEESHKQLQNELEIAHNKLYFYEGVISPELDNLGIKVHSFEIAQNGQSNNWNYELVLMQSQKGRRFLDGSFEISLSILEGDSVKKMPLPELNEGMENKFKFKYFQTLQGNFSLPDGVVVDEVIVGLNVAGSRWNKAQEVVERYDWRVLTNKDTVDLSEFDINVNSTSSAEIILEQNSQVLDNE